MPYQTTIYKINKIPLYSTRNYIQYSVTNHNGKVYENIYVCVCVHAFYFASVMSDSLQRFGLKLTRLPHPWDSPGRILVWVAIPSSRVSSPPRSQNCVSMSPLLASGFFTTSASWFSSVQSLSRVWLFVTPRIAAHQASLSITNSWNLLKPMSIESVMPSNHLILCHPLLLLPPTPPSIRSCPMSQLFAWGGQSIGVSASASVLPINTQDWSPLGWTGWISL